MPQYNLYRSTDSGLVKMNASPVVAPDHLGAMTKFSQDKQMSDQQQLIVVDLSAVHTFTAKPAYTYTITQDN